MILFLMVNAIQGLLVAGPLALLALGLKWWRVHWWRWVWRAAGVCLVVIPVALVCQAAPTRTVARAVAPDGTEVRVIQRCKWDAEMFDTAVYYHRPGGRWGWFYYDHQDDYWGRGQAVVDPQAKRISIYRGTLVTATFDWETERYQLLRNDFPHREFVGAQQWLDAPPHGFPRS